MDQIIPPSFLFDYSMTIARRDELPGDGPRLPQLSDQDTLFVPARLNETPVPRVRMAWNPNGLAIEVRVRGRRMPVNGRWSFPLISDVVRLFVNTRHRQDVQRATSFCSTMVIFQSTKNPTGNRELSSATWCSLQPVNPEKSAKLSGCGWISTTTVTKSASGCPAR